MSTITKLPNGHMEFQALFSFLNVRNFVANLKIEFVCMAFPVHCEPRSKNASKQNVNEVFRYDFASTHF